MQTFGFILNNSIVEKIVLPFEIRNSNLIEIGISALNTEIKYENFSDSSNPIFIFSAGWGSGSTLLQRLIVSSNEVFIWGEPYDNSGIIQKMANFLAPINSKWPPKKYIETGDNQLKYSDMWIGNLYPNLNQFKNAQREFYKELFEESTKKYNVKRWGIKEVRLTIDHAKYLKWLFPNSKFLFIYRNLYDAFLSIRGTTWYSYWPKYRIGNPIYFAHYWKKLVKGFINRHQEVDGLLIKYENLISKDFNFENIKNHLNIKSIDPEVLQKKLGSRGSGKNLKFYEKIILKSICHEEMKYLYPEI